MKPGCRTAPTRRLSNRRTRPGTRRLAPRRTRPAPRRTRPASAPVVGRSRSRVSAFGVLAAILCVLAGVAGAVLLARTRARDDAAAAHRTFERSSAQLTNSVRLALEKQEGLAVGAGAFWSSHPRASAAELDEWARAGHILRRYPGLEQVGFVALVPVPEPTASANKPTTGGTTSTAGAATSTVGATTIEATATSTASAATQAAAAGPGSGAATGPPRTTPSRSHRYTCSTLAQLARRSVFSVSGALNYCAKGTILLRARDSGATSYALVSIAHKPALVARVPLYRGNATPHVLLAAQGAVPRLAARAVGTHRGAAAGAPWHLGFRRAARLPPRVLARGAHQRHSAARRAQEHRRGGLGVDDGELRLPDPHIRPRRPETRAPCSWRGSSSASSSGDWCWS